MTPPEGLLTATLLFDCLLGLIGLQLWQRMSNKERTSNLMAEKLYDATAKFAKHKRELHEANLSLRGQLEKAEAAWGDLQTQIQYKDQEMTRFLSAYKRLETNHLDMTVKYNNLVGQYNFLTSKSSSDEMPI